MKAMHTALALVILAAAPAQAAPADKTPQEWQAIARADLDATRAAIAAAHPGYIDKHNPAFRAWYEQGYREAGNLIPRVVSYDTMMAAVRYYVTGFRDGHFNYSDHARKGGYGIVTSGWMVDQIGSDYVVVGHYPAWDGPLPPFNARLLGCDGHTPAQLITTHVAPFIDRREMPAIRRTLAASLGDLQLAGLELKRCAFVQANGQALDFTVRYHRLPGKPMMMRPEQPAPFNSAERANAYSVEAGVLWIRAQNFQLAAGEGAKLGIMLDEIAALQGVRQVVFDARHNGGGDSTVGEQMIVAATGGLAYDHRGLERLPQVHAQWRVSQVAIDSMGWYLEMMTARYGAGSARARSIEELRARLQQAKDAGQDWFDEPDTPRLTRAAIAARGGKLRRFDGPVALVTDDNCASACLDFADAVLRITGAVHIGQTTSSDTVYLEQGRAALPSGNQLAMPIKVWRNRARGDSEALVPDVFVDIADDAAVRAATIKALAVRQVPRESKSQSSAPAPASPVGLPAPTRSGQAPNAAPLL